MKRHAEQAQQFYKAILHRGQTWTRNEATLTHWAEQFEQLEADVGSRKRIQRCLDWYCSHGCGALFVPLIGTAETFRQKFEQLDAARKRLKGQSLKYFDDFLDYTINERQSGSEAQKEYARVIQRVQQQIQFVDDLCHNRVKLPAVIQNGKASSNGKLTKTEKERLADLVLVSRDHLFDLLLQNPAMEERLHQRMQQAGFFKRLGRYMEKLQTETAPF